MATGYRFQASDFDNLFDPDVMGDGPTAPAYRVGGAPLRYAAVGYGQRRADVGYKQNGVDVATLWAAKGTAQYRLPFHGHSYSANAQAPTNASGSTNAIITLLLDTDGRYYVRRSGAYVSNPGEIESGIWLPSGHSIGEYEVQFSTGPVGSATITNNASSFSSLSQARSISFNCSVASASQTLVSANVVGYTDFRRTGGNASRSEISVSLSAQGWQ